MILCPVPKNQLPINEFKEFSNSWFFKLPLNAPLDFFKFIFNTWLLSIPIISIICEGSYQLNNKPFEYLFTVFLFSFLVPITIFIRQFIGWDYIYKRLISKVVIYEESDWHDGQRWLKTLEMNDKDILIAKHEVFPVINFIQHCIKISFLELIFLFLIYLLFLNILY